MAERFMAIWRYEELRHLSEGRRMSRKRLIQRVCLGDDGGFNSLWEGEWKGRHHRLRMVSLEVGGIAQICEICEIDAICGWHVGHV